MATEPNLTISEKYGTKYTGILARQLQQEHSVLTPYVTIMPMAIESEKKSCPIASTTVR